MFLNYAKDKDMNAKFIKVQNWSKAPKMNILKMAIHTERITQNKT